MLATISGICSCAVDGTDDVSPLNVSIIHQGKAVREGYLVLAADEANSVESVFCPSEEAISHNLVCTDSGFRIEKPARHIELTIKIPGFHQVTRSIDAADLASDETETFLDIALAELEPFECTQDYCTGFEIQDGLERFERMAVVTQSEFGPAQALKFYISGFQFGWVTAAYSEASRCKSSTREWPTESSGVYRPTTSKQPCSRLPI